MQLLLGALLIFCLRICDVSIGTLRTTYMVRGDRVKAVPLAFFESLIWVLAISRIFQSVNDPARLFAYAAGFAAGTFVGITLEQWIASGWILARVVVNANARPLATLLRTAGFGVTILTGEGKEGDQSVLFVVALRKRGKELLAVIRRENASAFVTVDRVNPAMGGYLPLASQVPEEK